MSQIIVGLALPQSTTGKSLWCQFCWSVRILKWLTALVLISLGKKKAHQTMPAEKERTQTRQMKTQWKFKDSGEHKSSQTEKKNHSVA